MTETVERTPTIAGDPEAERAVLAACLNIPVAIGTARASLTADSFYAPINQKLFTAMLALDDRSHATDPMSVYGELLATGKLRDAEAPYLHTLYAYPFLSHTWAVRRVRSLAQQRERASLAQRIGQIGSEVSDPDDMADALMAELVQLEALIDVKDEDEIPGLYTWDAFLARPRRDTDQVIPGMLDRQEVVMVLAAPGVGKSWLSRQVALNVAGGIHPFITDRKIPRARTLLIDLENPDTTVQTDVAGSYYVAKHHANLETLGDHGWFWTHTEGLNIRKRPDAVLLERVVADVRPDLICVGSLYNLFQRGSSDWDTSAEETIAILNRIRSRYGCALWIEHHMPTAAEGGHKAKPFGSSLWERWPSYGRVLTRIVGDVYEFAPRFRGDRVAGREFPPGLRRGGKLSWSPIWDADEVELARQAVKDK
jgi:hypothetical protein